MKKFKVKYQKDSDILLEEVEAYDLVSARYKFYMKHNGVYDILEVNEVKD